MEGPEKPEKRVESKDEPEAAAEIEAGGRPGFFVYVGYSMNGINGKAWDDVSRRDRSHAVP